MLPMLVSGQLPSPISYTTSASGAAVPLVRGSPAPGAQRASGAQPGYSASTTVTAQAAPSVWLLTM